MSAPLYFVTGFEPYFDPHFEVGVNPSGELALGLVAAPPGGLAIAGGVLPVSLGRAPAAYDALLRAAPRPPAALIALGMHRGETFRLERRARARLASPKRDNDGRLAAGVVLDGEAELRTALDLGTLAAALRAVGASPTQISNDAGGYVCERVYHHALGRARELGVPALFFHVPPVERVALERQRAAVVELLRYLPKA